MKILETREGHHLVRDLDFGNRYSGMVPFYPLTDQYSYELDQSLTRNIVDDILVKYNELLSIWDENDEILLNRMIEVNSALVTKREAVKTVYALQKSISEYGFNRCNGSQRHRFMSDNRQANFSDFVTNNIGMCTEFSVLGHLLCKEFGWGSSLVTSWSTIEMFKKVSELHTLLYLDSEGFFWGPVNFVSGFASGSAIMLPSIYVCQTESFDLVNDLYLKEGGVSQLVCNPEHNSVRFRFNLELDTKIKF